jgi:hypothetical protein
MALSVAAAPTCEQINIVADYYSASTSAILTFGVLTQFLVLKTHMQNLNYF